jgi:zinc transport system substrate-binding protein
MCKLFAITKLNLGGFLMSKKVMAVLMAISISVLFSACGVKDAGKAVENSNLEEKGNGKIEVITSFNAMAEFTKAVGKDKVDVEVIVPNGSEPHDFEPKARDIKNIHKSKVFVYNGLGIEAWQDKAVKAASNKDLVLVEASKGCDFIKNGSDEKEDGSYDPHTWLSLKMAKIEVKNIEEALIKVDGKNKSYYENNYNEFTAKLDNMYNEYKVKFDGVKNKNFVTGHAAFAYLCRDFNIKQNSLEDVFAEGEPTPKKMQELTDFCKKNNVKTIFVEDMVSPKVSETLAKEVNGKAEKIYTGESKDDDKDYITSMKEDLDKIYKSLSN